MQAHTYGVSIADKHNFWGKYVLNMWIISKIVCQDTVI